MKKIFRVMMLIVISTIFFTTCADNKKQHHSLTQILIVGGGSSHNFDRWFNLEDSKTLSNSEVSVRYTSHIDNILPVLPGTDILYLSNNKAMADSSLRRAIFDFVQSGNDLLLVHAPTWYNWGDWPAFNQKLVGGGSESHHEYGPFQIKVAKPDHPMMQSLPRQFEVTDELYRFKKPENGSPIHVLAKGTNPENGNAYPVIWTVDYGKGQIACITLGHDGKTHQSKIYKKLLRNTVSWFRNDES